MGFGTWELICGTGLMRELPDYWNGTEIRTKKIVRIHKRVKEMEMG